MCEISSLEHYKCQLYVLSRTLKCNPSFNKTKVESIRLHLLIYDDKILRLLTQFHILSTWVWQAVSVVWTLHSRSIGFHDALRKGRGLFQIRRTTWSQHPSGVHMCYVLLRFLGSHFYNLIIFFAILSCLVKFNCDVFVWQIASTNKQANKQTSRTGET